jgi:hypothetical protein
MMLIESTILLVTTEKTSGSVLTIRNMNATGKTLTVVPLPTPDGEEESLTTGETKIVSIFVLTRDGTICVAATGCPPFARSTTDVLFSSTTLDTLTLLKLTMPAKEWDTLSPPSRVSAISMTSTDLVTENLSTLELTTDNVKATGDGLTTLHLITKDGVEENLTTPVAKTVQWSGLMDNGTMFPADTELPLCVKRPLL